MPGNVPVESLDSYRLLEQIGRGGMATVYKAIDANNGKYYALKIMSPGMAQHEQFTRRFQREAEVVMSLQHPGIVPILDFGQDGGYAYLVMPLLRVGSLADRLKQGPLTPAEGGMVMDRLADALAFAHAEGVIHRDVKPSNVLMDEAGNPLLADFGLARIHDASVSLTGSALLGTPAYMSPEQARGEQVSAATDQYSLGVLLFQLCTGALPFEAETPMAVMLKHINEPIPLARAKAPNVPEAIEHVILKATAKRPKERFRDVREMNQALQAALAHAQDPFSNPAPVIEVPPSSVMAPGDFPIEPPRKPLRLRRLVLAAATLLLLLFACPVALDWYESTAEPVDASGFSEPDMSGLQLTAQAGTIEAMSTQLAEAGDSPESVQTMVAQTLVVDFGDGVENAPAGTATPVAEATATPDPPANSGN